MRQHSLVAPFLHPSRCVLDVRHPSSSSAWFSASSVCRCCCYSHPAPRSSPRTRLLSRAPCRGYLFVPFAYIYLYPDPERSSDCAGVLSPFSRTLPLPLQPSHALFAPRPRSFKRHRRRLWSWRHRRRADLLWKLFTGTLAAHVARKKKLMDAFEWILLIESCDGCWCSSNLSPLSP